MIYFRILSIIAIVQLSSIYCLSEFERRVSLTKLVQDIIKNENVPSVLFANICWNKYDQQILSRTFGNSAKVNENFNSFDLRFDEATNKIWFFIDMHCNGADHFLRNLNQKYFAHPFRWIITDGTEQTIVDLHLLPDSNVILVNFDDSQNQYILNQGKWNTIRRSRFLFSWEFTPVLIF